MALRTVTLAFNATRLDPKVGTTCSQLEGCDLSGNATILPGPRPVNDGFPEQGQTINGIEVVQFLYGDVPYCAKRSVFEHSTEIINNPLIRATETKY